MSNIYELTYDSEGRARHMKVESTEVGKANLSFQDNALAFIKENAELLGIGGSVSERSGMKASIFAIDEKLGLRFEKEKQMMDTTTVSYVQTMFGLPIYESGISVTMQGTENSVIAATSTLAYGIEARLPETGLVPLSAQGATVRNGAYDSLVLRVFKKYSKKLRVNKTSLLVYRFDQSKRLHAHSDHDDTVSWGNEPPPLEIADVDRSMMEGKHYVVVDVLFTLPLKGWGDLNWRAFIEIGTGSVLFLRPLVDGASALVFERDPITKTGLAINLPSASAAVLDIVRDTVTLSNLDPVSGTQQALSGTFIKLTDHSSPFIPAPTEGTPFNFNYSSRSNNFAAANAYHNNDRFFRMINDLGFNVPIYFGGTSFPIPVDHRGLGNVLNANCPGNSLGNGIGQLNYALADTGNVAQPISIAADWRVVIHEIGGHGILWNHVNSPNFGFAHSAGDGLAAIQNDPESAAPDRFQTFPWVNVINRRHDRPVNGWGFFGVNDGGGYSSEQILATCHFRIYRSLGGDSATPTQRRFAADTATYLIVRAVGQLTPATNPGSPLAWEGQLETADAGTWIRTNPAETHCGGAYHKVIRWAFEKQGLFRASGDPATVAGKPPAVDVFIDDGRHGEYQYQPVHWNCQDIWNRTTPGAGGGVHEDPIVGQTNFAYVRIKNRGTQVATNVVVKGFHCLPGVGLVFPTDWNPMTTSSLAAPNIAANDMTGVVVGPFQWVPSQVGHECMFFSVSATGDAGNIDGHVTGPIGEWRLVPHDNNLGQRNVSPVEVMFTPPLRPTAVQFDLERLPFWIRNHSEVRAHVEFRIKLPAWLEKLGWKVAQAKQRSDGMVLRPGELRKAALTVTKQGKPFDAKTLAKQKDRLIVVTVLKNGIAEGGMTFSLEPPKRR